MVEGPTGKKWVHNILLLCCLQEHVRDFCHLVWFFWRRICSINIYISYMIYLFRNTEQLEIVPDHAMARQKSGLRGSSRFADILDTYTPWMSPNLTPSKAGITSNLHTNTVHQNILLDTLPWVSLATHCEQSYLNFKMTNIQTKKSPAPSRPWFHILYSDWLTHR